MADQVQDKEKWVCTTKTLHSIHTQEQIEIEITTDDIADQRQYPLFAAKSVRYNEIKQKIQKKE